MNTFMVKYAQQYGVKKFIGILSSCIFPDVVKTYPNNVATAYRQSFLNVDQPRYVDVPAAVTHTYIGHVAATYQSRSTQRRQIT